MGLTMLFRVFQLGASARDEEFPLTTVAEKPPTPHLHRSTKHTLESRIARKRKDVMEHHYGQIGSAEDDARHNFTHPLRERHDMAELMGHDLLSLDSGLSVCDEEESCTVRSENLATRSKAKKNIDFLTDVVADKLSEEDNNDEYAYVPKTGE